MRFSTIVLATCLCTPMAQQVTKGDTEPVSLHWGTPVYTASLWGDDATAKDKNAQLRKAALFLEENDEGVLKSNAGGYQSHVFNSFQPHGLPVLQELEQEVVKAATDFYVRGLDASQTTDGGERQRRFLAGEGGSIDMFSLWINVNREFDYNNPHIHSDCFISGAYYVDPGTNAGSTSPAAIVFSDPRPQPFSSYDYGDWFGMSRNHFVEPKAGQVVLFPCWLSHRVESVAQGDGPRVTISFNMRLRPAHIARAVASSHPIPKEDSCIGA